MALGVVQLSLVAIASLSLTALAVAWIAASGVLAGTTIVISAATWP